MAGLGQALRRSSAYRMRLRVPAAGWVPAASWVRERSFSTAASRAAVRRSMLENAAPAPSSAAGRALYTHIQEDGLEEERRLHEYLVAMKYDSEETQQFYAEIMGDGTGNLHFGKWDGIDALEEGAFAKASIQLTEWMWAKAMHKIGGDALPSISYMDLGAGNGSAARLLCGSDVRIHATCVNIAPSQNENNMLRSKRDGLDDRITVKEGTFMDMPDIPANSFDGCFSQDALLHAFSKEDALREALRITRAGGFLVLCDLHRGQHSENGHEPGQARDDSVDKSQAPGMILFETDIVAGWQELVEAARRAGWCDVEYHDMSEDLRCSYLVMGQKTTDLLASGKYDGSDLLPTLQKFQQNLYAGVDQVERGAYTWGLLLARKPPAA